MLEFLNHLTGYMNLWSLAAMLIIVFVVVFLAYVVYKMRNACTRLKEKEATEERLQNIVQHTMAHYQNDFAASGDDIPTKRGAAPAIKSPISGSSMFARLGINGLDDDEEEPCMEDDIIPLEMSKTKRGGKKSRGKSKKVQSRQQLASHAQNKISENHMTDDILEQNSSNITSLLDKHMEENELFDEQYNKDNLFMHAM